MPCFRYRQHKTQTKPAWLPMLWTVIHYPMLRPSLPLHPQYYPIMHLPRRAIPLQWIPGRCQSQLPVPVPRPSQTWQRSQSYKLIPTLSLWIGGCICLGDRYRRNSSRSSSGMLWMVSRLSRRQGTDLCWLHAVVSVGTGPSSADPDFSPR